MGITFGWRIPDFPVDGSTTEQFARRFLTPSTSSMDTSRLPGAGDHFFPWMARSTSRQIRSNPSAPWRTCLDSTQS